MGSKMDRKTTKFVPDSTNLPDLTGNAYNFIRKYADITWKKLAEYEGHTSTSINQRQHLQIVKVPHVIYLYNTIVSKFGHDNLFWRGLDEFNKLRK